MARARMILYISDSEYYFVHGMILYISDSEYYFIVLRYNVHVSIINRFKLVQLFSIKKLKLFFEQMNFSRKV